MLSGKTALITGGSRGIGAAIARKFASMGADIAIIYAGNQEAAQAVCAQCEGFGVKAAAYQCNVADFEEAKNTVAAVRRDFGGISILVNSAGITKDGLIPMMREDAFDAVISTNLRQVNGLDRIFEAKKQAGRGRPHHGSHPAGRRGAGTGLPQLP